MKRTKPPKKRKKEPQIEGVLVGLYYVSRQWINRKWYYSTLGRVMKSINDYWYLLSDEYDSEHNFHIANLNEMNNWFFYNDYDTMMYDWNRLAK